MLVSDDDFMPKKPMNQNLIDQMKKKITSKENSNLAQNKERQRSKTLLPSNASPHNSTDLINAGRPVNYQASHYLDLEQKSTRSMIGGEKLSGDDQSMARSFISNNYLKKDEIKDLNMFDKEELANIKESSKNISRGDITESNITKTTLEDQYNTNHIYKKKLRQKIPKTMNVILKEIDPNGMDGIDSLSSGYTEFYNENSKDTDDFINYAIGFIVGFFLSIFGVILMLTCSRSKRKCEGATHGMVVSGIIALILFNGYFITTIKRMNKEGIDIFGKNTHGPKSEDILGSAQEIEKTPLNNKYTGENLINPDNPDISEEFESQVFEGAISPTLKSDKQEVNSSDNNKTGSPKKKSGRILLT